MYIESMLNECKRRVKCVRKDKYDSEAMHIVIAEGANDGYTVASFNMTFPEWENRLLSYVDERNLKLIGGIPV